ncbi:MAG: DNA topoisomerase 3 [bacterium]|nr:DNA topoisomerase 3 [bacterium]
MTTLIITEKPSVAGDIAKVLKVTSKRDGYYEGNGYQITWAFGHLLTLVHPEEYDPKLKSWQLATLPIMPSTFKTKPNGDDRAQAQLATIKRLILDDNTSDIVCATDAGREGELIFRYIYAHAETEKPIKRLWISSQTDKAIKDGFDSLKDGKEYVPLFESAICRSEADWLIGINATRSYTITCSNGQGVMSVGRVQTPVLKMIVERYREHQAFESKEFFEIFADINHENGTFAAKWFDKDFKVKDADKTDEKTQPEPNDRLNEKEKAETILNELKNATGATIHSVSHKSKKEKPPLLYDLTELQRDANKRFKFSANQTLKIAQSLYESHKVLTYPRTSSRYLSTDMVPQLAQRFANLTHINDYKDIATALAANPPKPTKRVVDDSKVTDHHAIILTDKKPEPGRLSSDEQKIFDLVVRRFLAAFLPDCEKNHSEIITKLGNHHLKATGTIITNDGWRAAYNTEKQDKPDAKPKKKTQQETEVMLPNVTKNDPVNASNHKLHQGKTKAPSLHNEASLLAAMETAGKMVEDEELRDAMKECGLGTAATRAQILERLLTVQYITRDKNKLVPTEKGLHLIDSIKDDELMSPELTGQWEKKLNDMAQGKYKRDSFMDEIRSFTQKITQKSLDENGGSKGLGKCPLCGGNVVTTPKAYSCSNWKEQGCKFAIWKTIASKIIPAETAITLLSRGYTDKEKGFKSKAGKEFSAILALKNGRVEMTF